MQSNIKVGFCGVGNMAGAILNSALNSGIVKPEQVYAFDPNTANLKKYGEINIMTSNREVCENSELIFLGIKPQMLDAVAEDLNGLFSGKALVSMLAGVSVARLKAALGDAYAIRVMPNTPITAGYGCTAVARTEGVPDNIYDTVYDIFKASGDVVEVKENEINRTIPLSSSAPAFFFRFIKAMVDSGVKSGMSYENSYNLAVSTMHGVSHLMKTSDKTPDELIAQVTSPGGTTLAGLTAFDDGEFEKMIDEVFSRTVNRADELGK